MMLRQYANRINVCVITSGKSQGAPHIACRCLESRSSCPVRGAYLGASQRLRSKGGRCLFSYTALTNTSGICVMLMWVPCLRRMQHQKAMQASLQLQHRDSPWSGMRGPHTAPLTWILIAIFFSEDIQPPRLTYASTCFGGSLKGTEGTFWVQVQEVATPGAAEEVLTRSGEVVQLFRRPGLSQSATKTLLRKVRCCQSHSRSSQDQSRLVKSCIYTL